MMHISGIGLAAPFGGLDELRNALGQKTSPAISEPYKVDTGELKNHVPPRKLRRVDHFTSMTLLAAYRALADAGYGQAAPKNPAIVLCSGFGPAETTFDFLDSILDFGAGCASPLAFSHSVHNIPAAMLAMFLNTPCPCTAICQPYRPVTTALLTARAWLEEGRAETVLVGAVDESTPLLEHVSGQLGRPRIGEGAAFFVLNKANGTYGRASLLPGQAAETEDDALIDTLCGYLPVKAAFRLAAAALRAEKTGQSRCSEQGLCVTVEKD
ncbi:beta-ketoacyl synthase chain length factor [Salidesulfovibrio onnuriiensis]|uniref:beta-ketoacyl synthase chain length factor n=1 Tax=Salidesulfovibrio onnuriiensis TaxID=2583823 RepID=UPI0011CA3295|nr:beta-ketoacyl synthase chain length factor [Salidesulfovibrio onnuriiensis]